MREPCALDVRILPRSGEDRLESVAALLAVTPAELPRDEHSRLRGVAF